MGTGKQVRIDSLDLSADAFNNMIFGSLKVKLGKVSAAAHDTPQYLSNQRLIQHSTKSFPNILGMNADD